MDQQANVNERNGSAGATTHGLAWDVGSFANDALTLTELQTQLVAADMREYGRRVWFPSLLLLAGMALGLAFFPIEGRFANNFQIIIARRPLKL